MANSRRRALWTKRAVADLELIHRFYTAERAPDVARRLMQRLRSAARAVASMPEASPVAEDLPPAGRDRHHLVAP